MAASSIALASASARNRYSHTPSSTAIGCDRADLTGRLVLLVLELALGPVLGQQPRTQLRTSRAPSSLPMRTSPSSTSASASGMIRWRSLSNSDTTTSATETASSPDSTASFTGCRLGLPRSSTHLAT